MNHGQSTALADQLQQGALLVKALQPAELADLLAGRPWLCGLLTTAQSIAQLNAPQTARAMGLPPGRIRPDGSILLLELQPPPELVRRAIRIAKSRVEGPLEAAIAPLRRGDGSTAGIYRGLGHGPSPWELPELIAGAPLAIPPGARLIRRDQRDRLLAILCEDRWIPASGLPPLEGAYIHALCGRIHAPHPLQDARDEPAAARFGFSISDAYRAEILACLAPGTLFAAVEERLARFDWIQVATTEVCQTWQHASGVFVELWLHEGRVTEAHLITDEAARRHDLSYGSWHRQGRPLVELRNSAELSFTEGAAPGPVTALELAPDGWAWLLRSADGVERRWAGRVEPAVRDRLFDALQRAGFPGKSARSGDRRITLAADGRTQTASVPDGGQYATLLAEIRAVQQAIAGSA